MIYLYLLVFVFGLIIGSFLNAVIYRLHSGDSIALGRSQCPNCRHALHPGDLVPLLSFIFLFGRCRYCQKKISWQYPLVELATAGLFLLFFIYNYGRYSDGLELLVFCLRDWLAVSSLIIVFVYDLKWMLIPDQAVLPAVAIALIINFLMGRSLFDLGLSLLIGFGFFALQYYVSQGTWIGGGDLRLGLLIGAVLSWQNTIFAIFLAYIIGAVFAVGLLAAKKANKKTEIPFGVFLAPATLVVMLWGDQILAWYFSLL